jgi:hypothetical protein
MNSLEARSQLSKQNPPSYALASSSITTSQETGQSAAVTSFSTGDGDGSAAVATQDPLSHYIPSSSRSPEPSTTSSPMTTSFQASSILPVISRSSVGSYVDNSTTAS